ncbi:MAG: nickel pincer cofactor biosynthesis protein LarB [Lachnospiraceae bacterium]|nr:nickel pincer cofactor biosynthesis protein LarB [Lachnospiraceae bacterium]
MKDTDIYKLLEDVADKKITTEEAALQLKKAPFEDMDFAKIDTHRRIRQGYGEVIYGEGKSASQIVEICRKMTSGGSDRILITRISKEKKDEVAKAFELEYNEAARIALIGQKPTPTGVGKVVIAAAGTSDISVAEEAAFTAEALGSEVVKMYDVGVAGLHRLFSHIDDIMEATVIVAIAGMEGALASVISGLADCPVIAVPTSVGYGASFGGLSALLSMLNSCASGVSVVNIDNGFGAGYQANMINHIGTSHK